MDWNALLNKKTCDVDNLFSSFYNKFNKLINKHAPMKTISNRKAKQLSKPWITKGIRISIKIKNKLYASGDTSMAFIEFLRVKGRIYKKDKGLLSLNHQAQHREADLNFTKV